MISFTEYAKIANHYCVCYFGPSDEYLIQLRLLKPILEKEFPELNLYIGCKDDKIHFLNGCDQVLKLTELRSRKTEFAHISEIKFNGQTHPIEDFVVGANIANFALSIPVMEKTYKCVIVTKGAFPTKPLEQHKIDKLKKIADSQNMDWEIDGNITGAGLVMGVESVALYEAASQGIETGLVPTGVGTKFYKHLFPNGKIINV